MRHLPSLAAIRVFEAAARHQNFTSAALELGMSQAAVSYQIKSLEAALGVPLFVRERGRVSLVETSAMLAAQVTAAFDLLDDAFARAREDEESTLKVSGFTSFSNHWLATRLGSFQLGQTDLAVKLDVDDSLADFVRDDIDVAIRIGMGDWPNLHTQFLMRVCYAPMASPAFIAEHGPFDTSKQILDSRLLSPEDRWWGRWFASAGISDLPAAQPGIRLDSQTIEGNAAIAGQGIAILNPVFWPEELRDNRLVQLGDVLYGNSSLWVVCPEHKRNLTKVKAFRDWIISEAEKDPMKEIIRRPPNQA
jgi:LysR family glycine cleavage system transcriptional activator